VKRRIALAPIGPIPREVLLAVDSGVQQAFQADTVRAEPLPHPAYAWDAARRQYSSTHLLRELASRYPRPDGKILGITECDLFIPMLSFVYGQAQLGGPLAVVSLARLRQEFYELPGNQPLSILRVQKEAAHELGHTFGLVHCADRSCPMSLSTNIHQLDLKGADFCGACRSLLQELS
jgi:archaemetzincin